MRTKSPFYLPLNLFYYNFEQCTRLHYAIKFIEIQSKFVEKFDHLCEFTKLKIKNLKSFRQLIETIFSLVTLLVSQKLAWEIDLKRMNSLKNR